MISVTPFDLLRISSGTGLEPKSFSSLMPRNIFRYDEETAIETEDRGRCLLYINSPPCMFLSEGGKCTVRGFAPLVCRVYPYTEGGRLKKNAKCGRIQRLLFGLRGPEAVEQYNHEQALFVRIAARWNRKGGTAERALGFLVREAAAEINRRESLFEEFNGIGRPG